ncbi:unnamed protein product [Rotaria socialis]
MLEIRIHCKFLLQNFNHLEDFISSIDYLPLNNNARAIEIKNKRYTIIQEAKRLWLNYFLNIYEIKIQEYEQQYQNEFIQLESLFSNNNGIINDTTMLNNIKEYINNRINRLNKCGNLGLKSECCVLQKNEAGGRLVSIKLPKTIHP